MAEIYDFTFPYSFETISLTKPINNSGNYFIKLLQNEQPIYIQTPKCYLKQGIIKSGKKLYCDICFSNENEKWIQWLESLEETCCKRIFENRAKWFENDLEEHDIQNYMTSPYKIYKSGKQYVLRVSVPIVFDKSDLKIYNENEMELEETELKENTNIISILEFKGIRCAVRSFQLEIEVKQMLVLSPVNLFNKCIIQTNLSKRSNNVSTSMEMERAHMASENNTPMFNSVAEPVAELSPRPDLENVSTENKNDTKTHVSPDTTDPTVKLEMTNSPHFLTEKTEILEEKKPLEEVKNAIENMTPSETVEQITKNTDGLEEVEIDLEEIHDATIHLKERNDVYYKMYKEAKKKAREAKMIALSNYLEAKRIKTTYLLDQSDSEDSDLEESVVS
jgi:HSP20 family molecular chaperone IbpA